MDVINKGGKAAQIGEERTFGGKPYVKTANGWRPKASGRTKADKPQSQPREKKIDQQGEEDSFPSQGQVDEKFKSEIEQVLLHPHYSQTQKIQNLLQLGIVDRKHIASLTGANYSRVYQLAKQHESQQAQNPQQPQQAIGLSRPVENEDIQRKQADQKAVVNKIHEEERIEIPKPTVDDRWDAYDVFTDMFATGVSKSLVAFGTGGVGKTYTWNQTAKRHGLQEFDQDEGSDINEGNYDFVKITGKSTAAAMVQALWEHNGKKIIFDDCDSVLEDDDAVNIFKGVLDTTGNGTVVWGSARPLKSKKFNPSQDEPDKEGNFEIPKRFKCTAQVMFISNKSAKDIPQPLIDSRAIAVDLSMNPKETIDRLRKIVHKMPIEDASGKEIASTTEEREDALDFLDQYADQIRVGKLNARTLGNIIKIQQSSKGTGRDWKRLALVTLTS